MQSNSPSLTKKLRGMFHASQSGSQPVPIHSSEPIGGSVDVAITTIETSLAALKEASSLMSKIPYISPVSGLLLQVLTMRDEIKQNKEEWGVVMRKLGRVAGLVVNVGESCQKYNLEENDLPPGLRSILWSLQNELGGIESLLKRSTEIGLIKKALLRKDLLRKVKQYDGELSNVLQTFQAELALDARFEQIAERRKGIPADPSGPSNVITSIPQEPCLPQIFFGRDAELAEILDMILTGIRGSRPARIAILGPGGYGKTTLANAALTHPQVQEQFGGARYFVACESVFSSGALLVELVKTLGVLDGGPDASWSHIHAVLSSKDSIICLDNFESPWEQASDMRHSVEELLSRVTALNSVTLLITIHNAARDIWEEIGQNYEDAAEELIIAVDYIPLAVSLLAHLAQATSPALLLKDWNQNQTKFIQMGQTHRLSNLEYSIQLSIDSGRMRANPPAKDLLGVLSMLSDGIHTEQLGRFKEILVDMDILSNMCTLQQCSLVHKVISSKYKGSLQNFYVNLASSSPSEAQPMRHAEMVLEVNNTKAMLFDLLNMGDHSDKLISQTVETLQQRPRSGEAVFIKPI
ncbi:P-loop containing nucleoside triphosphate hydrolase protein [Multifurca ochricompacta]|uniref:P-loop containing nucleoside triphosphate hydrolase protein n=1 Tax=Multifurca ochricompacta TaxID=376703 RepID=A0AAD4QJV8_9AGAM|nr:P-loop containing nucleoside triphosphate hydrolase protein [Multifurca ochricompacta]